MQQFRLPDPGEGLVEAEIVSWKVKPGDQVKVNDIVVEVETAKSLVELPIPWSGTVTELLVKEGDTVEVGTPIITIDTGEAGGSGSTAEGGETTTADVTAPERGDDMVPEAEAPKREANLVGYGPSEGDTRRRRRRGIPEPTAPGPATPGETAPAAHLAPPAATAPAPEPAPAPQPAPEPAAAPQASPAAAPQQPAGAPTGARPLAKPPVRKYAKDMGVDLSQVTPSREDGVITRADVDRHLAAASAPRAETAAAQPTAPPAPEAPAGAPAYSAPVFDRTGERETRIPVKGVRKMTAQAMVASAFTAPHVTEFITVDATATMELVERLKQDREFKDLRVSPLLILAKAVTIAVRRNPGMNAVWDEQAQEIVQRNYVNLGIAAATPRGLIVPNIKDADLMNLRQLAEALNDLVATARAGRTQPAQMSGGTITITNVGVFGVDTGTPIINPGESAIVCFGAIRRQPWVVTNAAGEEEIVPRWVTQLSVSFDHRLIDGELGSKFLADLAALIEDPSRAMVWG